MTNIFDPNDSGMLCIKMAYEGVRSVNAMLKAGQKLTPHLKFTMPHTLFYGPGGTGKTSRVEESAKLMGLREDNKTFVRVNADCLEKIEDFLETLRTCLSWDGYLCNQGHTDHTKCNGRIPHWFPNPEVPIAPVRHVVVFIDEIHLLSKDIQEKLGLIMLDFRYQTVIGGETKSLVFPRFTIFAATTKPGLLIKPLRTRFANKICVPYYSDEETTKIVEQMASLRGWKLTREAAVIAARMAQGIARECGNHLEGMFNCWMYSLKNGLTKNNSAIDGEIAKRYATLSSFVSDGLTFDQLRILQALSKANKEGKYVNIGVNRLCNLLGVDQDRFMDEIEPRLIYRKFVAVGVRGREITQKGKEYIDSLLEHDEKLASEIRVS